MLFAKPLAFLATNKEDEQENEIEFTDMQNMGDGNNY